MSAQPLHEEPDPQDPAVILRTLPARERVAFQAEYRERAQAAADDIARFPDLRAFLQRWALRASLMSRDPDRRPGLYEEIDALAEEVRAGTAETFPIQDVIAERFGLTPDEAEAFWQERLTAAQGARDNRM
ncbi:DUF6247 family protein [Actinomadura roseirufa]|uniref:DUF6247 family protein n=1 Tax=Actinomadura roseirufa TaxID=2094049 RepID=UPI0010418DBA|nr:DUF6247 family protein [Actinomadura roseirufa]